MRNRNDTYDAVLAEIIAGRQATEALTDATLSTDERNRIHADMIALQAELQTADVAQPGMIGRLLGGRS
jgi:hypothetical protein